MTAYIQSKRLLNIYRSMYWVGRRIFHRSKKVSPSILKSKKCSAHSFEIRTKSYHTRHHFLFQNKYLPSHFQDFMYNPSNFFLKKSLYPLCNQFIPAKRSLTPSTIHQYKKSHIHPAPYTSACLFPPPPAYFTVHVQLNFEHSLTPASHDMQMQYMKNWGKTKLWTKKKFDFWFSILLSGKLR